MRLLRLAACALAFAAPLSAEIAVSTVKPQLRPTQLFSSEQVRRSGMIFSGTVMSIAHLSAPGSPGITQITFKVDNAVRGTRTGQIVRIREWQGLWTGGERYIVGQRLLLFLYPKSRLGLTSPVGGALGRYQIDKSGSILLNNGSNPRPKPIDVRAFAAQIKWVAKQ